MIDPVIKQYEAKTYYVKEQEHGWWGYFTVVPAIGLLQAYTDFGNYSHRWNAPGPDFKVFLIRTGTDYVSGCFEATVPMTVPATTMRAQDRLLSKMQMLMTHLWPLFIEQLKQERAKEGAA
jgi:hypothetical protein